MNNFDYAWAAGIIDGEGCIGIQKNKTCYYLRLVVKMVHKPTLERLQSIFGYGIIHPINRGSRIQWSWQIVSNQAFGVLTCILPFMTTKKDEAEAGIEFVQIRKKWKNKRDSASARNEHDSIYYKKLQELKKYEFKIP